MAKDNQLKLLYILDKLYKSTDEEHYISAGELADYLKNKELPANRKSIYGYIDSLKEFGIDIDTDNNGNRILNRQFQLPELKLLVDAVQSSRFISAHKSKELIGNLETLTSEYYAAELKREVFVENTVKSENNLILNNIDAIHKAINSNKKITFNYFNFVVDFSCSNKIRKEFKHYENGEIKVYDESPVALIWKNENYYLLAYDSEKEQIKTFRVDKISNVNISAKDRLEQNIIDTVDINKYADTAFSMYGGESRKVEICAKNELAGVVFDRFGFNISMQKKDEEHFSFMAEVQVSKMFYSWLSGFGDGMKIVYPQDIVQSYKEYIKNILEMYEK